MWTTFRHWFIHLFTPHCDECEARKQCKNCDQLYMLLERERLERSKLIDLLTLPINTETAPQATPEEYKFMPPLTWRARREQLERDSFLKAHAPKDVSDATK